MAMFDPVYVTQVFNEILSRRGLKLTIEPKSKPDSPRGEEDKTA